MSVIELRKNQPFKIGDKVRVGTGKDIFTVIYLGHCGPVPIDTPMAGLKGELVNSSEFVGLRVPGMERCLFNIHVSYLKRV